MGVKVLIVDDAAFMRMMIKNILSKSGYDIVGEAENGVQAVANDESFGIRITNIVSQMERLGKIQ